MAVTINKEIFKFILRLGTLPAINNNKYRYRIRASYGRPNNRFCETCEVTADVKYLLTTCEFYKIYDKNTYYRQNSRTTKEKKS